jgi:hypothetical protein
MVISTNLQVDLHPTDREQYIYHSRRGSLPPSLRHKQHTLQWPVRLTNNVRVFNYYHQAQYDSTLKLRSYPHLGIDIQCNAGTKVFPCEAGRVVFCERDDRFTSPVIASDVNDNHIDENSLSDVYVESNDGITYVYRHLQTRSLPESIRKISSYNESSNVSVLPSLPMGFVGKWWATMAPIDIVRPDIRRAFGDAIDHLHLEMHISTSGKHDSVINPILLLQKLSTPLVHIASRQRYIAALYAESQRVN